MSCEEDAYVIERMGKLLAEIAIIVNGTEPHDTLWSYHDLPDKVRALKDAQQPAAAVPEGMPVATRFRHKPTDALPGHGWIYEDGDVASTLTDKPFPGLEVQLLRATTVWPQAAAPSKGVVTKIGGKDDASGCYKVLLGEKEYVRHGDMYTVWFESRDPRTGEIRRRNRIVMNASTRARIDSAISAMLAAADKENKQ